MAVQPRCLQVLVLFKNEGRVLSIHFKEKPGSVFPTPASWEALPRGDTSGASLSALTAAQAERSLMPKLCLILYRNSDGIQYFANLLAESSFNKL